MKRELFGKVRAKKAALRHNHPSKNVQLILVAGEYGKTTTARLLAEVLRESGKKTAVFTNRGSWIEDNRYDKVYDGSADAVQGAISSSKKQGANLVIMEVTDALLRTHVLGTLQIEMAIATSTGGSAQTILAEPAAYAVVPSNFSSDSITTAPHQMISFGDDESSEMRILHHKLYRKGTEVELKIDHHTNHTLATQLLGKANVYNVAAAVAAAYVLGVSIDDLPEGVARLEEQPGNFQRIQTKEPYDLYLDGAVATRSIELAIESALVLAKRRVLIATGEKFDEKNVPLLKSVSRATVVNGQEAGTIYAATSSVDSVAHTLRAAKKDDIVLLLGHEFAVLSDDGEHVAAEQMMESIE